LRKRRPSTLSAIDVPDHYPDHRMTKKKKPKKLLVSGPETGLPPTVSLRGQMRAVLRTAVDKTPGVSLLVKWHDNIASIQREERLAEWLEYVRGEHTAEEFQKKIDDGLRGPHGNYVRDAVLESTRAATDALDDAAIPAIARLTSRYLHSKTPDLWTYRHLLAFLRSLDGEMLDALRVAIVRLDELIRADVLQGLVSTEFHFENADDLDALVWQVFIPPRRDRTPAQLSAMNHLGRGPVVQRLATALTGSSVGLFNGDSRGQAPLFSTESIEILLAIL
jgi:hypothetical protein